MRSKESGLCGTAAAHGTVCEHTKLRYAAGKTITHDSSTAHVAMFIGSPKFRELANISRLGIAFQVVKNQKKQLHGLCASTRCDLADSTAEIEGYHEEHCMAEIRATKVRFQGTIPNLQEDYKADNTSACEMFRSKLDGGNQSRDYRRSRLRASYDLLLRPKALFTVFFACLTRPLPITRQINPSTTSLDKRLELWLGLTASAR
jgi:hypothetical protein